MCSSDHPAPLEIYEEGTLENDCPTLKPIEHPTTAVAFVMQAMNHTAMNMPLSMMQKPRVWVPCASSSVGFKHVYDGFMSAKRVCVPHSQQEALQMIVSENAELLSTSNTGMFGSRRVSLSIVIPDDSKRSSRAYEALDAFASLSQLEDEGGRVTKFARFSMFVGVNAVPMQHTVFAEAMTQRNCYSETLVMRWMSAGPNGPYIRTEVCRLAGPKMDAMSIQTTLVCHAVKHGVKLTPVFFKHPPDLTLKDVLEKASTEFRNMVYDVPKFDRKILKDARQCDLLEIVDDIYLRISPRRGDAAEDTKAVMADSAMHALLLCRDGASQHAKDFVRHFKEGLPPAKGFIENDQHYFEHIEWMALHALVIGVDRVCVDSVISLYGCSGIPGEKVESSGSFVWRNFIAMQPIHTLQETCHVLPCSPASLIPANTSLAPFVKHGLDEAIKAYNRTFMTPDSSLAVKTNPINFPVPDKEDLFLMAALKLDLTSSRCTVGETLAFLTKENAPTSLLQMIVSSANKLGLHSPLSDVFTRCSEAINHNDSELNVARGEVARLKRVCDAALLVGCSKRACKEVGLTNKKKVSQVLKLFGLSPMKGYFCADQAPRDAHSSNTLASLVVAMCKRRSPSTSANSAELRVVLEEVQGAMDCIPRAIEVCCADKRQDCFLFVHGERDGVECYAVEAGELVACTVGRVFEAERPCVASVKQKDGGCLFTPLIKEASR